MDIMDELCPVLRHGCAAHAAPHGNLNAGVLPLKRTQHQSAVFQQVKPRPVESLYGVVEQCCGVGKVRDPVGYAVDQSRKLLVQRLIVRCHFSLIHALIKQRLCSVCSPTL